MVTKEPEQTELVTPAGPEGEQSKDGQPVVEPKGEAKKDAPQAEETLETLRAALAVEKAARTKEQADFKAIQNGVMKQAERDKLLQELSERTKASERRIAAIGQAIGTSDIEGLPEELANIDRETQQTLTKASWEEYWLSESTQLMDAVIYDGKPVFDLNTAPELATQRGLWNEAADKKDRAALKEARLAIREAVIQKAVQQIREGAKTEANKALESARKLIIEKGVNDLSTPGSAGGTAQYRTVDDWRDAFIRGEVDKEQYRAEAKKRGVEV